VIGNALELLPLFGLVVVPDAGERVVAVLRRREVVERRRELDNNFLLTEFAPSIAIFSNSFSRSEISKSTLISSTSVWAYEIAANNAINNTLMLCIKINYM